MTKKDFIEYHKLLFGRDVVLTKYEGRNPLIIESLGVIGPFLLFNHQLGNIIRKTTEISSGDELVTVLKQMARNKLSNEYLELFKRVPPKDFQFIMDSSKNVIPFSSFTDFLKIRELLYEYIANNLI